MLGLRRACCVALSLHALNAAQAAAADEAPAPVAVDLSGCEPLPCDPAELFDKLGVELARRGLHPMPSSELAGGQPPIASLALTECNPNAALTLRVLDARGALLRQRVVSLAETPLEARPRTLALVLAESLPDPLARPAPAPAALPSTPAPARAARARAEGNGDESPRQPTSLGLSATVRSPMRYRSLFWGAEVHVRGPLWSVVRWAMEGAVATNTTPTPLGDVRVSWWSASLGIDLADQGAIALAMGPRLSVARVLASGDGERGVPSVTQSEDLALLGGRASLGVPVGAGWAVQASLDLQYALRGLVLTAGGAPSVSLDEWIVSSGFGVAYRL